MENLKYFGVSELSVAESIEIEGGAPTNSTSLAYDIAYTIASWFCSPKPVYPPYDINPGGPEIY